MPRLGRIRDIRTQPAVHDNRLIEPRPVPPDRARRLLAVGLSLGLLVGSGCNSDDADRNNAADETSSTSPATSTQTGETLPTGHATLTIDSNGFELRLDGCVLDADSNTYQFVGSGTSEAGNLRLEGSSSRDTLALFIGTQGAVDAGDQVWLLDTDVITVTDTGIEASSITATDPSSGTDAEASIKLSCG